MKTWRPKTYGTWQKQFSEGAIRSERIIPQEARKASKRQPNSTSKKREKNQINKIRNEKGKIATNNTEMQRIIREYYEQLQVNKMENLEEMDRYFEKISPLRLNQVEIEIMNNTITKTEIETVIKNLPKTKAQGQIISQVNSIKHSEKS